MILKQRRTLAENLRLPNNILILVRADLLQGKGSIIEIWGLRGSSPAIDRHRGLWESLSKYPQIKSVGEIDGKWELDTAKMRARKDLKKFPEFDLVFAHNDVMAYGAHTVCRELFPGNQVKFIGIDALPGPSAGIQFVDDKILTASFLYPTGGEECIRIANQILNNLPYGKENILHSTVIDDRNVRVMKLQSDKLSIQQKDIVRQQQKINDQIQTYYSQRILIYILLTSLIATIIVGAMMLPGKEGCEISKTLKEDLRTSHIPIIILSARGSIEQKIVGVQSGADEYITKPFVFQYLQERIKALIRNREVLKEHYSHDLNIDMNAPSTGNLDKEVYK